MYKNLIFPFKIYITYYGTKVIKLIRRLSLTIVLGFFNYQELIYH